MLIFNTTYHVDDEIQDQYLGFMKTVYIPQAINSGFLCDARLAKIHARHEVNGASYSLQFRVKNIDTLNHWLSVEGENLSRLLSGKFGGKAAGFITLLDEIEL